MNGRKFNGKFRMNVLLECTEALHEKTENLVLYQKIFFFDAITGETCSESPGVNTIFYQTFADYRFILQMHFFENGKLRTTLCLLYAPYKRFLVQQPSGLDRAI